MSAADVTLVVSEVERALRFLVQKHGESQQLARHVLRLADFYAGDARRYAFAHERPLDFDADEFEARVEDVARRAPPVQEVEQREASAPPAGRLVARAADLERDREEVIVVGAECQVERNLDPMLAVQPYVASIASSCQIDQVAWLGPLQSGRKGCQLVRVVADARRLRARHLPRRRASAGAPPDR